MKKILFLSYLAILTVSNTSIAGSSSEWYFENYEKIEDALSGDSNFLVIPIVTTLGDIWRHKDGAIGAEVAPMIAKALINKPKEMLSWFSHNPKELESFINELPNALLTEYSGKESGMKELIELKQELELSMKLFVGHPKNKDIAKKILNKVKSSEIRTIQ